MCCAKNQRRNRNAKISKIAAMPNIAKIGWAFWSGASFAGGEIYGINSEGMVGWLSIRL
jgi:hypothetical protein